VSATTSEPTDSTPAAKRWARRLFPFLAWWPRVDRGMARDDLMAGLTSAVVVLPQCVAFSTLAGMPVEYGLYCAMVPAIVAALFGSSWQMVSGPTNAISIVLFASLAPLALPGSDAYVQLALTVTLLCGLMQLAMGLARLGALVNFISHTVIVGFMAAAALVIANAQIRTFFGVEIARGASIVETWSTFLSHLATINPWVTAVGTVTLLTAIAIRRLRPRWPYMIVAMVAGSIVAWLFDHAGVQHTGITTVGVLPASLPPLSWPVMTAASIRETAAIAAAITILGLTEAVSIARSIALRSGQRIDSNQEFIGQGLSNIAGAFFSGYASSGSFNRSGVNYDAGARSPIAAASSALFLLAILFAVAPLAAYLPHAAMAGVLFIVAWGLVDVKHIGEILHSSRSESVVLAITFFSGVFISLEFCILAGVILSLLLYLNRLAHPSLTRVAPMDGDHGRRFVRLGSGAGCPQLTIVRLDGSLFYGAIEHVRDALRDLDSTGARAGTSGAHHVLVIAESINRIDLAGAQMLKVEADRLAGTGGALHLAGLKQPVMAMHAATGALDAIGAQNRHQKERN
jgi:SulP family sulfate permease